MDFFFYHTNAFKAIGGVGDVDGGHLASPSLFHIEKKCKNDGSNFREASEGGRESHCSSKPMDVGILWTWQNTMPESLSASRLRGLRALRMETKAVLRRDYTIRNEA